MTDFLVTAAFTFVRRGEQVELYHEHGLGVLLIAAAAKVSCYPPPEPRLYRSGNFV